MKAKQFVPLSKLATPKGLIGGPFGSSLGKKDYIGVGVPVIRGQNLAGPGRFNADEFVYVSEEKANGELGRNLAEPGDVVFTQRGTLGQVGLVPREPFDRYVISQSQMRLRVDRRQADPLYIYYCFRDPQMLRLIESRAIVTGVPHINLGILAELPVPYRPLPEQQSIARVLGSIDDKIAHNERMCSMCEDLGTAMLSELLAGADASGELVDACLGDIADVNAKSIRPGDGYLQYLDISSVGDGWATEPSRFSWAHAPGRARRGVAHGDVLWSTVRPNRRSHCLLLNPPGDLVVSTGFAVLTPKTVGPSFLFAVTDRQEFVNQLVGRAEGSAYPAVRSERFLEVPIPLPGKRRLEAYERATMPLRELAQAVRRESMALAALRDGLLPSLLSGELLVGKTPAMEELA